MTAYEQLYPDGESQTLLEYYYTQYLAKCEQVDMLRRKVEALEFLLQLQKEK